MRQSLQRHPIAILRNTLGTTQTQFAALVGCSFPTVRGVEVGQLKLSQKLAGKISEQTNANLNWLLQGDPKVPATDVDGLTYTSQSFEKHQVNIIKRSIHNSAHQRCIYAAAKNCRRIFAMLLSALKSGDLELCSYNIENSLRSLEKRFPGDKYLAPMPVSQSGKILFEPDGDLKCAHKNFVACVRKFGAGSGKTSLARQRKL